MFCAGCSIADELFDSFQQLLTLADSKGAVYDRQAALHLLKRLLLVL